MRILGVDTTVASIGVALWSGRTIVGAREERHGIEHSRRLIALVRELLDEHDTDLADLDSLAAARGPGSFTGVRVGLATINGLAWALGKPLFGCSTLAALAASCEIVGSVVVMVDARRGEVFAARFAVGPDGLERLCEDAVVRPEEAVEHLVGAEDHVIGDGAQRYRALIRRLRPRAYVTEGGSGARGVVRLASASSDRRDRLDPLYLRQPHLYSPVA